MTLRMSPITPAERISAFVLALVIPSGVILSALMARGEYGRSGPDAGALVSVAFTASHPSTAPEKPQATDEPVVRPTARSQSRTQTRRIASRPETVSIVSQALPHRLVMHHSQTSLDLVGLTSLADRAVNSEHASALPGQGASDGAGEQGSSGPAGSENDEYGRIVLRRIRQAQHYASSLQRRGITGTVVVAFSVDRRGRLRAAKVVEPSGSAAIDHLALRQLADAAPFPRPPKAKERHFRIPMTYRQTDSAPEGA